MAMRAVDYSPGNGATCASAISSGDMNAHVPVGDLLRAWRQRRHLSQLHVATEAEVSTRHLSFLETGRAQPSREMVLRLAALLEIPLRERNALLLAAGFAPMFSEHPLTDPALAAAREAVNLVLKGHEPFPARRSIVIGICSSQTRRLHRCSRASRHTCSTRPSMCCG